ncbi:hypothetical protein BJF82_05865 [Kytococcus sp. CUA-901]|nr:hypothetical protein BJF82_05865 [Kytococcus sp. CUA-901]
MRLAGLAGRRLDDTAPCVDGLLPGGIRLHAVLPPLVDGAAHLSLRVPREVVPSIDEMLRLGTVDELGARVLRAVVEQRLAFVVSGGTGSGKTTLLATLLSLVDPADRILVVEASGSSRCSTPTWCGCSPARPTWRGAAPST